MSGSPFPTLDLTFLKLGGSLITDKSRPYTPRPDVLERLASEIAAARLSQPERLILLGHGSGSFGHVPAEKYGTWEGVHGREAWHGFVQVWREAARLNRIVMDALEQAGLPAISFPPSAGLAASDRKVDNWDLGPIQSALQAGLLPVVFGDVVFDRQRGGTIFSTEDLFTYLAPRLLPARILLAGIEPGVWRDYPGKSEVYSEITPSSAAGLIASVGGSAATDVTGGMASKVIQSLEWVERLPGLEVMIFSGEGTGLVEQALGGGQVGTLIRAG
jgi:isopentenyl phosphate kinase